MAETIESAATKFSEQFTQTEEPKDPPKEELKAEETELETEKVDDAPKGEEEAKEVDEQDHQSDSEDISLDADQLAGLLGLEDDSVVVNDEGQIRFKTKVDGEEGDATLSDFIERYQRDAHLTNQGKELASQRQQYQTAIEELSLGAQQNAQYNESLLQTLQEEYLNNFQGINWNDLKADNPEEYMLKRQDLTDAQTRFKSIQDKAKTTLQEQVAQIQSHQEKQRETYLQQQALDMKARLPDWNEKVGSDVTAYLKSQGFNNDEISSAVDAKSIELAYKAMLFDKGKDGVKKLVKKVLPKVLKPGVKKNQADESTVLTAKLKGNLKKSGSMEDAAAIFRSYGTK